MLAGLLLASMSGCSPGAGDVLYTKTPSASAAPSAPAATTPPEPAPTVAAPEAPVLPSGLALVVVLPGDGSAGVEQADAVRQAVTELATANAASVTLLDVGATSNAGTIYERALDSDPDVVVTVGPTGLDALQQVAAAAPERQFLVVGAQPLAPAPNITAVVWPGSDAQPVAADLAARVAQAVTAGASEIAAERRGLVIALP
ncbi:hypothetical protein NVV95_06945 [Herbiconiux sp. CPCC 205716]|uniref:BMP family ABC transporter substrate-binding protein n=1 Tax=Herbiconiux gentiana TaxID=2970912 RepID=A0ABT2GDL6_9MICO|nr:hypothetical protein [Herbiconiux gentiana]MCS5714290.1 hypothetical protein [Herbiconiux gentiana]